MQEPFGQLSTRQLFLEAKSGRDAALDEIFQRYLPRLSRWARGRLPTYLRDSLETGDLVQHALLNAFRSSEAFEPRHDGAFLHFLQEIVRNRIRDEHRRRDKRPPMERSGLERIVDDAPSPLEKAVGRDACARYQKAVSGLKPRERDAIIARFELGMKHAEIARELELPSEDAARMVVKRALERLVEKMANGSD